ILFLILNYFYKKKFNIEGYCSSLFLILYGIFRIIVEFIREPDNHIGYIFGNFLTNGIFLSIPMIIVGLIIFININEKHRTSIKK
ncbi:MAG: prolipoprotein diacylglyceryl transferase family protein, partial [Pseudomonadota bacterium]|nr:prolipoprotein diacylglyceryl transferase family protein [Pseudomonadota bacterium]